MTADNWKPIESAPKKDGSVVILFGELLTYCINKSHRGEPMGKHVAEGRRHLDRWWVGLYECLPTHWQPMPKRPTE